MLIWRGAVGGQGLGQGRDGMGLGRGWVWARFARKALLGKMSCLFDQRGSTEMFLCFVFVFFLCFSFLLVATTFLFCLPLVSNVLGSSACHCYQVVMDVQTYVECTVSCSGSV